MIHKKITTVFLLGQYGSGKDTHGPFVADMFGLMYLSFSTFLSQDENIRKKYIEQGLLVPDSDVFRLLASSSMKNVLFNGFPRTLEQLKFILQKCQIEDIAMVYLDVTDEIAIRRMENRLVLQKRPDDTPENIIKRIASFREKTLPILDEAEKAGMKIYRIRITKEQSIEATQKMIKRSLCKTFS